ncbi:hypothetical protein M2352_000867 [Azospirillum fermentarium]|uniref:hypothetical protein n=1 Tax=Azospirillum fermentarium TaxID=1233114 RepID=UPI0022275C42|nr:hypothetical protein [Azospirillum fermentarium]MCW2245276.1 hypothetical protein [Azospirillum fermentarium]
MAAPLHGDDDMFLPLPATNADSNHTRHLHHRITPLVQDRLPRRTPAFRQFPYPHHCQTLFSESLSLYQEPIWSKLSFVVFP